MDNIQHDALRRLFYERRLLPWEPEHDLFIQAELASLKILEPHDYDNFKNHYDEIADKHKKDHPEAIPEAFPDEVPAEAKEITPAKKSKKKSSPTDL